MLTDLKIENIAIIERADIEFHSGLNVMTGETGAGKSIIIDALNAVLGERTSKELVRTGASQAKVSASFSTKSATLLSVLDEFGIASEDDGVLIISRSITSDGRNSCRINGSAATVSMLRALGHVLIDIHGQHDNQSLLNSENHCGYIDSIVGNTELLDSFRSSYSALCSLKNELRSLLGDENEKARETELLQFQIDEISGADIFVGEYDELRAKQSFFRNSEKIADSLRTTSLLIDGDGESAGALQQLKSAVSALETSARYYAPAEEHLESLRNAVYLIEEESFEIASLGESLEYDPHEAARVDDRLDEIHKLMRKYGASEEEILQYVEKCVKRLNSIVTSDERIEELRFLIDDEQQKAERLANELSASRKKAAEIFSAEVMSELSYLDMPGVLFEVSFEKTALGSNGIDSLEFLISANPGEQAKPLVKTASGGELSRIMLAIKNVLSDRDTVETMIFDEIDTGVSGSAADKLGRKLHEVSSGRQVICVTHLAQIAARADSHLFISKSVTDGKTYTSVSKLERQGQIKELARIVGGMEITALQLSAAEELLERAENDNNFGGQNK